jgi:hypothetical protein
MGKLIISVLALSVVSCVAGFSLLYETHANGHLTKWGHIAAILTVSSFVLGVAAEIYKLLERQSDKREAQSKHFEQRHQLGRIEAEVKASTKPLLPVVMDCTFRFDIKPETAKKVFQDVRGFGTANTSMLRLMGTATIGEVLPRNSIEFDTRESHCILEDNILDKKLTEHHYMVNGMLYMVEAAFFLKGHSEWPKLPTITLEHSYVATVPREIKRLELFDSTIFRSDLIGNWTARSIEGSFGLDDLVDARLRFRFTTIGDRSPFSIHNLHVFFGPKSSQVGVAFPSDILAQAKFGPSDDQTFASFGNEMAREMFMQYRLELTCDLSKEFVSNKFIRIVY